MGELLRKGQWPIPVERERHFGVIDDDPKPDRVVYFIGPPEDGPIKIGMTRGRTDKRLALLQTATHVPLVVLGSVGSVWPQTEKMIHTLLRPHCLRGEWFERVPALALLHRLELRHATFYPLSLELEGLTSVLIEAPHWDDEEDAPLRVDIIQALVHVMSERMHMVNTILPLPFRAWLATQLDRQDGVADLVYEALIDDHFPHVGTLEGYMRYILDMHGSDAMMVTIDAWLECDQAIMHLIAAPTRREISYNDL